MQDLGPHAAFIVAAYGVTFVAVAALSFFIVEDDRKQRRLLADLGRRGIRRRSASAQSKPGEAQAGKPPRRRRS
jgi:heme exporter protein D